MSRYFVQEVYGKRFSGVNPSRLILTKFILKVNYLIYLVELLKLTLIELL